jgi:hypothetical protein
MAHATARKGSIKKMGIRIMALSPNGEHNKFFSPFARKAQQSALSPRFGLAQERSENRIDFSI